MKYIYTRLGSALCALLLACYCLALNAETLSDENADSVIIGYVFSPDKPLDPDTIAAEKLTHINYAFSNIENNKIVNGFDSDDQNYRSLQTLKERNPTLKILSSVGGWTWSGEFSDMALSAESRQTFINSAVAFVRRHRLDGIDIDWEYPGLAGAGNTHRPEDGENFTLVLKGLRKAFDALEQELDRPLLITIATGGFTDYLAKSDTQNWHPYLDFLNIMAYDFNFPREGGVTGHHTALYSHPDDSSGQSADAAVKKHLAQGVPPHKLVLGLAFYGRVWTEVRANNAGFRQPGNAGEASFGRASYTNLSPNVINQQGFVRHWDNVAQAPWLWNRQEQTFVSYDDPQSITAKVHYARDKGLAGVMFWQYTSDYQHELLNAINAAAKRQ